MKKNKQTPRLTRLYDVKITRAVRMHASAEVEATLEEEAQELALAIVDAPRSNEWREDEVVDQRIVVRPI